MNHYFLVASLPALTVGARPGVTVAEFLRRAAEQLGPAQTGTLREVMEAAPGPSGDDFTREWAAFDTALRNACARQRAARRGGDPRPHLRDPPDPEPAVEQAVATAFNARDPMERERALDALRWNALESMAGFDPFAFRALLAYALRLRMAWRWAGMDPDRGRTTAARIAGIPPAQPAGTE